MRRVRVAVYDVETIIHDDRWKIGVGDGYGTLQRGSASVSEHGEWGMGSG